MYFIEQLPNYLNKVFDIATESNFQLRSSFQKLKCLFRKTNNNKYDLSYIGSTLTQSNVVTILIPSNILKNISKRNLKILIIFFELVFNFLL